MIFFYELMLHNLMLQCITINDWLKNNISKSENKGIAEYKHLESLYLSLYPINDYEINDLFISLLNKYYLINASYYNEDTINALPEEFISKYKELILMITKNNIQLVTYNRNSLVDYVNKKYNTLLTKTVKWNKEKHNFFKIKKVFNKETMINFISLLNESFIIERIHLLLTNKINDPLLSIKADLLLSLLDKSFIESFQKEVTLILNKLLIQMDLHLYNYKEERYSLFSLIEADVVKGECELRKSERIINYCYSALYPIAYLNVLHILIKFKQYLAEFNKNLFLKGTSFHQKMHKISLFIQCYTYFLINTKCFDEFVTKHELRKIEYYKFMNTKISDNLYVNKEADYDFFNNYINQILLSNLNFKIFILWCLLYVCIILIIYLLFIKRDKNSSINKE